LSENELTITALGGMPRVAPGDDLAALLIAALEGSAIAPRARDILVVTSKIVSKAEGRYRDLVSLQIG
jgi:coenzyme F420-0:L-glutamate ligase/coenzyme F420-1:gamma-L-glutamate ligase